jgi:hypothetical protein
MERVNANKSSLLINTNGENLMKVLSSTELDIEAFVVQNDDYDDDSDED